MRTIKKHLFIQIFVAFIAQNLCGQIKPSTKSLVQFHITPSTTDSSITSFDSPHLVVYNPSIKQGKLLIFLTGTGGIPPKKPNDFFLTAIEQGYRVISLSYFNLPAGVVVCAEEKQFNKDPDCVEKFRIKRIYGENVTSLFPDEPQDAIINRITKLLVYLANHDKQGNWEKYLQSGDIKWNEIALSGQSQGGGMAAFIAKRSRVARVISFSGGWDYAGGNKIASWYSKDSVTPPKRWYATYHVEEPKAMTILESCKAMKIPDNHILALSKEVRQTSKAHGAGISDKIYKPEWIQMLGKGN